MKKIQPLYFAGALYEFLRFGLVFLLAVGVLAPALNRVFILVMVMLAAPGLIIFAGFILLGIFPDKYQPFSHLLALGKLASVIPLLVGLLNTWGVITFTSIPRRLENLGAVLGFLILFDLLFFTFLISYSGRNKRRRREPAPSQETTLPEMSEIEVKEK